MTALLQRLSEIPRAIWLLTLVIGFALVAIWAAIAPFHRGDWALENVLVVLALAGLAASYRKLPLSRVTYGLIFIFLCLHEIGSHYTYSKVPYDAWFDALFRGSLSARMGWERNHYDRLLHFAWGFLLAYPVREVVLRISDTKGFWGYFLPLNVLLTGSLVYELIEWAASALFGGDLGVAYLGTQGDQWDAQKDMLAATIGAVLSLSATAGFNAFFQRDFAREWNTSLRVRRHQPLGEEEFARQKRGGKRG